MKYLVLQSSKAIIHIYSLLINILKYLLRNIISAVSLNIQWELKRMEKLYTNFIFVRYVYIKKKNITKKVNNVTHLIN